MQEKYQTTSKQTPRSKDDDHRGCSDDVEKNTASLTNALGGKAGRCGEAAPQKCGGH